VLLFFVFFQQHFHAVADCLFACTETLRYGQTFIMATPHILNAVEGMLLTGSFYAVSDLKSAIDTLHKNADRTHLTAHCRTLHGPNQRDDIRSDRFSQLLV
jgi:hypothetical protein